MENAKPTYRHYGHKMFDRFSFKSVRNSGFNKPIGGFWASRTDSSFGWKEWNDYSQYQKCEEDAKIVFQLTDRAKVLELRSMEDVKNMNEKYGIKELAYEKLGYGTVMPLDFEKIKQDYDAIECFISTGYGVYDSMPDWDCDSIVILNPDVVEQLNLDKKLATIADKVLSGDPADLDDLTADDMVEYIFATKRQVNSYDIFR